MSEVHNGDIEVSRVHVFGCIAHVRWQRGLSSVGASHVLAGLTAIRRGEEVPFFTKLALNSARR